MKDTLKYKDFIGSVHFRMDDEVFCAIAGPANNAKTKTAVIDTKDILK